MHNLDHIPGDPTDALLHARNSARRLLRAVYHDPLGQRLPKGSCLGMRQGRNNLQLAHHYFVYVAIDYVKTLPEVDQFFNDFPRED